MRILMYSGGVDSRVLDKVWKSDMKLYVPISTPYVAEETKRLPKDVIVAPVNIQIPYTSDMIPYRNMILAMVASTYCTDDYNEIAFGFISEEDYNCTCGDTSTDWRELAEEVLCFHSPQINNGEEKTIEVVAPLTDYSKAHILGIYKNMGGDIEELSKKSFSCYHPKNGKECGECDGCREKRRAFKKWGIDV
ncbi:MAG: 7-cyano-7-deazaguanine synthase [Erysipelotrichaceae bacterium]|nr:7-cyano-7-deazaguanine synthase [Erysipelotrichaceae bacterium]